jgi:hypothetical protein
MELYPFAGELFILPAPLVLDEEDEFDLVLQGPRLY